MMILKTLNSGFNNIINAFAALVIAALILNICYLAGHFITRQLTNFEFLTAAKYGLFKENMFAVYPVAVIALAAVIYIFGKQNAAE